MKKVILKCRVADRDVFEDKLSEIDLDFSAIYWQHDRVYVPRGYKRNMNLPRLVMRTEMHAVDEPPTYRLILRRHIEDSGVDVVEETPVQDYETTVNIIMQLGFRLAKEVSRRRQELSTGEGTVIYLDQLDNVDGSDESTYAKIESVLADGLSVTEVRNDLVKTFQALNENNFVESAYFEL